MSFSVITAERLAQFCQAAPRVGAAGVPGWIQRRSLGAWIDALLPLSLLGLMWERSGNPAGMVWILALWCAGKLALRLPAQPVYALLIGILAVSVSAIIHPLSVSAPTDLILVLLAFAAGLQQSNRQWQIGLWCVLGTVLVALPFVELDRFNGNLGLIPWQGLRDALPQAAVRIQKITINRSGYLFGLLALVGYGLFRFESHPWKSRVAAGVGGLSLVLAFGTGSRAALAFPVVAALITELCWRYRGWVARRARPLTVGVLSLAVVFNLLLYVPSSPISSGDASDEGRARVAQCFVVKALRGGADLATGRGYDRVSDRCAQKVFLPGYTKGIPHAHNAFLQVLADQGLVTLGLMVVGLALVLQRLMEGLVWNQPGLSWLGLACTLFMLASALVESTLLKTSLQQVMTGYLLSIAWRPRESHSIGP